MVKFIEGGVCAPLGFKASGIYCGIRQGKTKKDLALIVSDIPASAAAVYTKNLVKGAPIYVTMDNLKNGIASAVICNSGIANTCNADGIEKAVEMCKIAGEALSLPYENIIVASTGVIGQPLNLEPIKSGISGLVNSLSYSGSHEAVQAIMTTDTIPKEMAVSVDIGSVSVKLGGMAKGSGMINPNMATMLSFLTTDAKIAPQLLSKLIKSAADVSFNRVSVDGDTSTNDMLSIMANGKSGIEIIDGTESFDKFKEALDELCISLSKMLAGDGEGATKLIECKVSGAPDIETAARISDSVINSPLVKTAMFGEDANWGRILCAIGYSGAEIDVNLIDVSLKSEAGEIEVCKNGAGVSFSEEYALEILKCNEITINASLNQGNFGSASWGCDLSYDYVKINGDYRT